MGKWENNRTTIEKPWENGGLHSGKCLHNYGISACFMGKSTRDCHFQYQIGSLPEGMLRV